MKIGVIDYGAGNLRSVCTAIHALGYESHVLGCGKDIHDDFTHLVLPGVGSFGDCLGELARRDLIAPLQAWIHQGRPYFGICLGYQILFESSEETPGAAGLGIFKGKVRRFDPTVGKIPHMGWNSAEVTNPQDPAWAGMAMPPYFYFVHSFFPVPQDESIIAARTSYGAPFASMVRAHNLFAAQFHPEKSQDAGLSLIKNFLTSTAKPA
jgi:glutamine amidotransferase